MRHPDSRTGWLTVSVEKTEGVPDYMPPHDLRHTAVSLATHAGVNPKLVQRIAGHHTFAQTMETYADLYDADLYDSDLDEYGEALDTEGDSNE